MTVRTVLVGAPEVAGEPALVTALSNARTVAAVRRCVDAVDVLGVASTGGASLAIIGVHLPRAGVELVERLRGLGLAIVGVADPADCRGEETLRLWGITDIRSLDDGCIAELVRMTGLQQQAAAPSAPPAAGQGRIIAVWGPYGAPGRTTVAVSLADELARSGVSTLLVDADPCGGAAGIHLGLLEESSGLVAACRRAEQGVLDLNGLARSARTVGGGLRVLTGLEGPTSWTHVRPTSLGRVLALARVAVDVTVVDVGFGLEEGASRGSSAVSVAALECADEIVAAASADPVGLARLAGALPDLRELAGVRRVHVLMNKVPDQRRSTHDQVAEALAALCDVHDHVNLPHDGAAPQCLRDGVTLAEGAPRAALRSRIREFAGDLAQSRNELVVPRSWTAA